MQNDFGIPNAVQKVWTVVYNVQDQLLIDNLTGSNPPAAGDDDSGCIAVGCGSIYHESYKAILIQLQQVLDRMHTKATSIDPSYSPNQQQQLSL